MTEAPIALIDLGTNEIISTWQLKIWAYEYSESQTF
jgi:hypothetical protein